MQFFSIAATAVLAASVAASPVNVQRDLDLGSLVSTVGATLGIDMDKIKDGASELQKLTGGLQGQAGKKAQANAGGSTASATGAHSVKPTITSAVAAGAAKATTTPAAGNDLDARGRGTNLISNIGDLVDIGNGLSQFFSSL